MADRCMHAILRCMIRTQLLNSAVVDSYMCGMGLDAAKNRTSSGVAFIQSSTYQCLSLSQQRLGNICAAGAGVLICTEPHAAVQCRSEAQDYAQADQPHQAARLVCTQYSHADLLTYTFPDQRHIGQWCQLS